MDKKTLDVAEDLGMSARTIREWVRKFDIPCEKNDYGHYIYSEQAIAQLEKIKADSEVAVSQERSLVNRKGKVELRMNNYDDQQLSRLEDRIYAAERIIEQKADEVVAYQLLQQRKEIEELTNKMEMLEARLLNIENKRQKQLDPPMVLDQTPLKQKRRGMLRSIFSL
ncbi:MULTISPECIES: MerR family transcriptional regulator [Bacillus]|uniref:MerR family transcriptional regulator n=1 Tax=Bacillus TaxID=1386 RepID=UPI000BB90850|nr:MULTISPECIES: MerR family transcriptional regulator [Bacillus]